MQKENNSRKTVRKFKNNFGISISKNRFDDKFTVELLKFDSEVSYDVIYDKRIAKTNNLERDEVDSFIDRIKTFKEAA